MTKFYLLIKDEFNNEFYEYNQYNSLGEAVRYAASFADEPEYKIIQGCEFSIDKDLLQKALYEHNTRSTDNLMASNESGMCGS